MAKNKKDIDNCDLDELREEFIKKYGEGVVRFDVDEVISNVEAVPTNIISIDAAFGIGGVPRGRIIEIFGPESSGKTTTCLQIAAAFQNTDFNGRKGRVAFVDAEHALDPQWAKKIGCNPEDFIFTQPEHGEQAYDIIEMIVKSGKVELIILDSIAALSTKDEVEGEITDQSIGAQARMNSKALKRIKGILSDNKVTLICCNQIREKIGVMFGCLHADTLIPFVDGRVFPIRQVYDEKIEGEVWSYNETSKNFEPRKIVDWHYNGDVEDSQDYLHISLRGSGTKNGSMQITVTPNHEVLHDGKFVPIDSLEIGDCLTSKQECFVFNQDYTINGTLGQFLTGVLSGDSHISHSPKKFGASLKLRDNVDADYMHWKSSILSNAGLNMTDYKCNSGVFYSSQEIPEFVEIKNNYKNRDPLILLNNFSWLGFAVWIMDDAIYDRKRYQLSIKRFAGNCEKLDEISSVLDELGLFHHISRGGQIVFDVSTSEQIASNIAQFVPSCMNRKLPIHHHGCYKPFSLFRETVYRTSDVIITGIRHASKKQMKQRGKYDLSIEHNHNYMAGGNPLGVIVHNSPEVTPGGRALKFYASVRIDVRRTGKYKVGENVVGASTKASFVKNKIAAPFKEALYNICYGEESYPIYGIDPYGNLIESAIEHKILHKSGNFIKYGEESLGNGLTNAATAIRLDPNLFKEIYTKTLEKIKPCHTPHQLTSQEVSST